MKVAKDPILNDFHAWLGEHIANAPSEEAIEAVEDFEELMEFMWKESAKFYQPDIEYILKRLKKAEELISRIGQDTSPPWDSLDTRGLCLQYLKEEVEMKKINKEII